MRKRRFFCIILSIVIFIFSLVPVSVSALDINSSFDSIVASVPTLENASYCTIDDLKAINFCNNSYVESKYNEYLSSASACDYTVCVTFVNGDNKSISLVSFDSSCFSSATASNGTIKIVFSEASFYCSFSCGFNVITSKYNSCGGLTSGSSGTSTSLSYSTSFVCGLTYGGASYIIDDNFLFGLTGISDYTFLDALGNSLIYDSPVLSQIDFIRNMFQNYFKSKTGITDDNELNDIMTATASGDFAVLDNYVSDSATKQGLIDSVSSMQSFYNDNFSYDSDNDTYTVLNYDPENNIYPSWYVTNVDISNGGSGSGSTSVNGSNAFAYGYGGNASASIGDIIINNNIPDGNTGTDSGNSDIEDIDISDFENLLNSNKKFLDLVVSFFSNLDSSIKLSIASLFIVVLMCRIFGR